MNSTPQDKYSQAIVYENQYLFTGDEDDRAIQFERERELRFDRDPGYPLLEFKPIATIDFSHEALAIHPQETPQNLLNVVFSSCQSDLTPSGWFQQPAITVVDTSRTKFRSLCVGDVICLAEPSEGRYDYWAVACVGFVPIRFRPSGSDNAEQRVQLSCWDDQQAASIMESLRGIGVAPGDPEDWRDAEETPEVYIFIDLSEPCQILIDQIKAIGAAQCIHRGKRTLPVQFTRSWLISKEPVVIEEMRLAHG